MTNEHILSVVVPRTPKGCRTMWHGAGTVYQNGERYEGTSVTLEGDVPVRDRLFTVSARNLDTIIRVLCDIDVADRKRWNAGYAARQRATKGAK